MVEIPLANGRGVALVDDEDAERVLVYRWYLHEAKGIGYARSSKGGYLHRLVTGLERGDGLEVDHISGDGLDNRRSNLRVVTHAQNQQNQTRTSGASRYRGVTWYSSRGQWAAQAQVGGRHYFGGYFLSEDDAGRAAAQLRRRVMPYATS